MTAFFVPGTVPGTAARDAYDELKGFAESRTGTASRPSEIYALHCRRSGGDSQTRVGEQDPCTGNTVRAIFATREGYTIVWDGGHDTVSRKQTYEAVEFD